MFKYTADFGSEDGDIVGNDDHLFGSQRHIIEAPNLDKYVHVQKRKTVRSIFRLSPNELTLFFEKRNLRHPDNVGECRQSLNILKDCGYINGLCQLLNTNPVSGIVGDQEDVRRREGIYGKNHIALPVTTSFSDLLAQQFEDDSTVFLIGASTVYLMFTLFDGQALGYIEALTIYSGVMFAALCAALSDWIKERQYLKLADEANKETCVVYRGAYGMGVEIPVQEIVVGDIIEVKQGYRVPADCILVEEMNIKVDQSQYDKSQTCVEKECSRENAEDSDNADENYMGEPDNHK